MLRRAPAVGVESAFPLSSPVAAGAVDLLGASAAGFYLPNGVLARLIERRQRKLFEDLPDAVDLMTVCVEAGLGFDAALSRVTDEIGLKSHALHDEFELVLLEDENNSEPVVVNIS